MPAYLTMPPKQQRERYESRHAAEFLFSDGKAERTAIITPISA